MTPEQRFITNGTTAAPFYGRIVPRGFREITEPEYRAMLDTQAREDDALVQAWAANRKALRESAKAKLIAGEPLTPEEADVVVG